MTVLKTQCIQCNTVTQQTAAVALMCVSMSFCRVLPVEWFLTWEPT